MARKPKHASPRLKSHWKITLILLGVGVIGAGYWSTTTTATPSTGRAASSPATTTAQNRPKPVPPYFDSAEAAKPFPVTLSPSLFRGSHIIQAYRTARQIPGVLAQQPCYCYCDRAGHRSLLDCFRTNHAANCLVCIKETHLAERMTAGAKSATEIRSAIIRGEWRHESL